MNGRPTDLAAKHRNVKANGRHGQGPSEVDVYQGSANKGFSSVDYRRLFLTYKRIRQAVLNQEQVPPGMRRRIAHYFWLIRPR